jgi:hypothetical protein
MSEDQARWMAELLETSIQVSGLSERELEKRLGWGAGDVGRLLAGETDIEPQHVLRILAELNGETPATDFDEPEEERTQMVTDLLDRFHRLGYEAPARLPVEKRLNLKALQKKIETTLREAFRGDLDRKPDKTEPK